MTEYSLPFPGTSIGDAGPYSVGGASVLGWWDRAALANRAGGRLTQTTLADIGVYYSVDDQLECTVAADTISIDVDTGASLVDGTLHYNDTDPVNVPIPAAGAGDGRIDLVVVRKNYDAITTYTPGGGAPTVGPRECRITVIRGTEAAAPAAPTVTQDTTRATYWDIPLCSIEVDDGGALSSLTDLREYVDAVTKNLFIPVMAGYNNTGASTLAVVANTQNLYVSLADATDSRAFGRFKLPLDYLADMKVTALLADAGGFAGNIYGENKLESGGCGEGYSNSVTVGPAAVAISALVQSCIQEITATGLATDDFIRLRYLRDATDPLDTTGANVYFYGWTVEYLGWK